MLLLLTQCSLFGPSASEKAEAGQLSRAIDQLRDAPNPQKAALLDTLKAVACETPDLCELQRVCVEGFGQHVWSLNETAHAKEMIAAGDVNGEAAGVLKYARDELGLSLPKIAHCADAQGAAHRKYKF